jgi:DNA-binding PadR family transcriptional regulator
MAKRRKVGNLLALAVLTSLAEAPKHPYELASELRERGKDQSIKINWGSLYTVVQNLEKHDLITATGTSRQGRHPERTVYDITPEGRDELTDWLHELLGVPLREFTAYEAALSLMGILPPDEVVALLQQRVRMLEVKIAGEEASLAKVVEQIPRLFVVETEYHLAMARAELAWTREMAAELAEGRLGGFEEWRKWHEGGAPAAHE